MNTPATTRRLANAMLRLWEMINEALEDPIRNDPVAVLNDAVEMCASALADVVSVTPTN